MTNVLSQMHRQLNVPSHVINKIFNKMYVKVIVAHFEINCS